MIAKNVTKKCPRAVLNVVSVAYCGRYINKKALNQLVLS
jgi:hypothetical protein